MDPTHAAGAERAGDEPLELVAPPAPALLVGIGLAEGGIDALKSFFIALEEDAGLSFVIVHHFDQAAARELIALLEQFTELPVLEIQRGMRVEPDHVYVAPPASCFPAPAATERSGCSGSRAQAA